MKFVFKILIFNKIRKDLQKSSLAHLRAAAHGWETPPYRMKQDSVNQKELYKIINNNNYQSSWSYWKTLDCFFVDSSSKASFTRDILAHNIAIKRYWDKKIILRQRFLLTNQGKLLKKITWFVFCLCTLISFFDSRHPWLKNIFLSQYLFIAILCSKMSCVNKA